MSISSCLCRTDVPVSFGVVLLALLSVWCLCISLLEESQVMSIQNGICYFYSMFKHILAQLQRSIGVTCVLEWFLWYASNS